MDWLPELSPQSVLRDVFAVRLASPLRWAHKAASRRMAEGRSELATKWNGMLQEGLVKNRGELAVRADRLVTEYYPLSVRW